MWLSARELPENNAVVAPACCGTRFAQSDRVTTEPTAVDEAALFKAFERARALSHVETLDVHEVLALEEALRPGASLRDVRDLLVPLLDRALLQGLAAAWDADTEQLSHERVIARVSRWLDLGVPELAIDVLGRVSLPGVDLTLLHKRAMEAFESDAVARQRMLNRNLEALKQRQPLAAAMIARMDRGAIVMRPTGSGVVHRVGQRLHVLLQASTPERSLQEARERLAGLSWEAGATCVAGATDGAQVRMALDHGPRSDFGLKARSVIALCDVNAGAVRALFEVEDFVDAIERRYLRVYAGVDLEAQLLVDFTRPLTARPGALLGDCSTSRAILKRVRERVTSHQEARIRKARERTQARAAEIRERFATFARSREPLRIALLSSRVSTYARHGVAATAAALKTLGHDVNTIEAPDEVTAITGADIAEAIEAQNADAVFAINFTRGTIPSVSRPVAFLTWDMDGCGYVEASLLRKQIADNDHVMLATPAYPPQIGWPRNASHPFPTPFNRALADAAKALGDVPKVADVAYISNYHSVVEQELEKLRQTCRERLPDALSALDKLANEVFAGANKPPGLPLHRGYVFATLMRGVTDPKERMRHHAVAKGFQLSVVAPTYRQRHLQAVADSGVDLALYGMGWETHPTLSKHARGLLEGVEALARGYLSAPVQLQIMFGKALHQRLADGAAAGACVAILPYPTDFAGRVRVEHQRSGKVVRPESMTKPQLDYLIDELRSYSVLIDMPESERVAFGLGRLGLATDDVIDPQVLDQACALGETTLAQKVQQLVADPAQRQQVAAALRAQAEQHLDPARLLDATLERVARVEAGMVSNISPSEAAE